MTHLGRWIIDRYRQEGLDMVLIVCVTSEDRIAELALRSNAGFTGSPNVRSFQEGQWSSIPLHKLAVREWVQWCGIGSALRVWLLLQLVA